jgi:TRAP-type C4-dicarboxylate transport system permease small subunit
VASAALAGLLLLLFDNIGQVLLILAAAGLCFLFGTGVTVVDVALRAVAGSNVPGAIELTSLSIGLGALLSMPVCYAKRAHVTA